MAKETYFAKVARYYNSDHKLTQYPSKRPLRVLVLHEIASLFEEDRQYTEKEVNEIIKSKITFTDVETLRRELFNYRYLGRFRDGSAYWLEKDWKEIRKEYISEV